MKPYEIFFTKQAHKDVRQLSPKLKEKLKRVLKDVIAVNPYIGKKLLGDFGDNYSYRLTLKDRIIYSLDKKKKRLYIKRARTHYGD